MDRSPIMVEDVTIPQSLKEERSLQRSSTYIEEFNDNINQQAVTDTYRNLHSTSAEYICHTYGDKPYLYCIESGKIGIFHLMMCQYNRRSLSVGCYP